MNYILLVQKLLLILAILKQVWFECGRKCANNMFFMIFWESVSSLKKTVTSTRTLTTEKVTYHDMLHKNLWVSHHQTLRYFLSNFLCFNHVRNFSPITIREPVKWRLGITKKAFGSKIHENRNGTNTHADNRCHVPNGRDILYIYIYMYTYVELYWKYMYFILYTRKVLLRRPWHIRNTFMVKGPLILLYLVI